LDTIERGETTSRGKRGLRSRLSAGCALGLPSTIICVRKF
jgi:hypothetical protein